MVGIVGYVRKDAPVPEGTLDAMAQEVRHLASHLREDYKDDLVHLARVHLGILNKGRQPVFSRDGSVGVVGEGMVYGLRDDAGAGQTGSWLKWVAQAFQERGASALGELNGSFSLLILDRMSGEVRIASDRFATRPIYYWHKGTELAFASEPKAILKYPSYQKKLNPVAVCKFFRYGRLCLFGDDTWFEGIMGLPPASILRFHDGDLSIERYWDLAYRPDTHSSADEFGDKLASSFRKAVRVRTAQADLRYSVALSGGLDSRAVLAACEDRGKVSAYTFAAPKTREAAIASKVARARGTKHLVCYLDPDVTARYAEDVVWLSDGQEVVGISFLLNADERLKDSFDVSIDGFALDLTLGGSFLRGSIMEAKGLPELAAILDGRFAVFRDGEMKAAFEPGFLSRLGDEARRDFLGTILRSAGETTPDRADWFALRTRVRNFTIMGHVLSRNFFEDTIPTLDNDFMAVVTSIPPSLRYHYHAYRKFLKRLDPSVAKIQYERSGMSPNRPYSLWMVGVAIDRALKSWDDAVYRLSGGRIGRFQTNAYLDLSGTLRHSRAWRDLVARTLISKGSLMYSYGIVKREYVLGLVSAHMAGRRDNREKMLYLITFELILRRFFADGTGIRLV
jgi:asparagine synthetase B (glutamine-hydrolysing)